MTVVELSISINVYPYSRPKICFGSRTKSFEARGLIFCNQALYLCRKGCYDESPQKLAITVILGAQVFYPSQSIIVILKGKETKGYHCFICKESMKRIRSVKTLCHGTWISVSWNIVGQFVKHTRFPTKHVPHGFLSNSLQKGELKGGGGIGKNLNKLGWAGPSSAQAGTGFNFNYR